MCLERLLLREGPRVMWEEAWHGVRKEGEAAETDGASWRSLLSSGAVTAWGHPSFLMPACLVLVGRPPTQSFMSSIYFQFTSERVGPLGLTWELSISPKPHPQPLGGEKMANLLTPGIIVRLWAGRGQREEPLGVQKGTRDIPRKSQAEQTAL